MDRQIVQDFTPFLRIYSDGQVERLSGTDTLPPSFDRTSNVLSKDIQLSKPTLSVRLYIPKSTVHGSKRLPLLMYFHGGAFCLETAASPTYHNYLNSLVSEADVIAVSVDYRRAPEHPLPTAYDDSWTAITWVLFYYVHHHHRIYICTSTARLMFVNGLIRWQVIVAEQDLRSG